MDRQIMENFAKMASCNIPWLERDLTKESYNVGQFRLMESPLMFLMRNYCLLDPAGNPFEFQFVFGTENPNTRLGAGHLESVLRCKRYPRWNVLPPEIQGEDFDKSDLIPSESSPYKNHEKASIIKNTIDKPHLREVLWKQLGDYPDFHKMTPWQYGLFAAFTLHSFSDATKKDALKLFDDMNISMGGEGDFNAYELNFGHWGTDFGKEKIMAMYDELMTRDDAPRESFFTNVLLSRLLTAARRRGVISTAQFGWLRGFDRTLWYTLSQTGRSVAISEAAGVYAHILVEDVMDKSYNHPIVEPAIEGFEEQMIKEGWLPEKLSIGELFKRFASPLEEIFPGETIRIEEPVSDSQKSE